MMSRSAAPSREVTMPILRGRAGSGRLRGARRGLRRAASSSTARTPVAARRGRAAGCARTELVFALRLVDAEPPARDDVQAVLQAEPQVAHRRAEHHRLDLRAVVLEGEVGVAGVPHAAVGDLAFHPDVTEARLESAADRRGQLATVWMRRCGAPGRRRIALVVFERLRERDRPCVRAGRWRRAPRRAPRRRRGRG